MKLVKLIHSFQVDSFMLSNIPTLSDLISKKIKTLLRCSRVVQAAMFNFDYVGRCNQYTFQKYHI